MTITVIGDTTSKIISWSANNNEGLNIGMGTGTSLANAASQAVVALKSYAAGQAGTFTALSTNIGIN